MPSPKFVGPRNLKFFRSALESPDMRQFIKDIEASTDEKVGIIMEQVGIEMILFLKSYTTRMQPPDYRVTYYGGDKTAPRPAHPGNWADISGQLRVHYRHKVEKLATGNWSLAIWNDATAEDGHNLAAYVESREGYFVVTGIMEPGGVVMWTLQRAIKRICPDWNVHLPVGEVLTDRDGNPIDVPMSGLLATLAEAVP